MNNEFPSTRHFFLSLSTLFIDCKCYNEHTEKKKKKKRVATNVRETILLSVMNQWRNSHSEKITILETVYLFIFFKWKGKKKKIIDKWVRQA